MHWVCTPGVAAQDAFYPQVNTLEDAPFFYGPNHVITTGGLITTLVGTQQRRQGVLIYLDQKDKRVFENGHLLNAKNAAKVKLGGLISFEFFDLQEHLLLFSIDTKDDINTDVKAFWCIQGIIPLLSCFATRRCSVYLSGFPKRLAVAKDWPLA